MGGAETALQISHPLDLSPKAAVPASDSITASAGMLPAWQGCDNLHAAPLHN